ncbi:MAG: hypothetical protein ABSD29_03795 [Verrucomicrobiota bacterium]|jgi:hypothetical protein
MKTTTAIFVLLPIAFETYVWSLPLPIDDPMWILFAVWILLNIACLAWGIFIRSKHPRLAWCCFIACGLQALIVLLPAFIPPGKTKTVPATASRCLRSHPAAAGNRRITSLLHSGHIWTAAPEQYCYWSIQRNALLPK